MSPQLLHENARPFPMIVGRGRSGTSLLRAILTSHSELAIPLESHFLVKMGRNSHRYDQRGAFDHRLFASELCGHWAFKRWGVSEDALRAALMQGGPVTSYADAVRAVYRLYAHGEGKARSGDKTPIYVLHVAYLARLLPEAKFIHIIRDGRDVALSYLDARWGPNTVGEAAWYWRRAIREGRRAGQAIGPQRYMEVRYEDLVTNPDLVTKTICDFIDLRFEGSMLSYFDRADELLAGMPFVDEHRHLGLKPTKGLRDWRRQMQKQDAGVFEVIAGDLLSELGYERTMVRFPVQIRMRAAAQWSSAQRERVDRVARKLFLGGKKKQGPVSARSPIHQGRPPA